MTTKLKEINKTINQLDKKFNFRNLRPIHDSLVLKRISAFVQSKNWFEKTALKENAGISFVRKYKSWISSSKLNHLINIQKKKYSSYTQGTTESFNLFYLKNINCRFRSFRGEYKYHFFAWRHCVKFEFLEKDKIRKNDAVVISLPYADNGGMHPEMQQVIDRCNQLKVPVLIDCAYFGACRGISFDFNQACIQAITFSLSKIFPVVYARIGMRLTRNYDDDTLDIYNMKNLSYINRHSASIGELLVEKFSPDFIPNKYEKLQKSYCKKLNLKESNTVLLGLGEAGLKQFNRGDKWNRLCLSGLYEMHKKTNRK